MVLHIAVVHRADGWSVTNTISFEVLDWNIPAIKAYEKLGSNYYGESIEQDGTVWKQLKIEGEAFIALQNARAEAAKSERW